METKYPKIIAILIVAFLQIPSFATDGDKQTYTRDLKKTFDVNSDALLEVTTDFTSVDIENWNQNKIEIVVEVDIEAKNEAEADKIFDDLQIEMSGGGSNVEFIANLGKSKSNKNQSCDSEGWSIKAYIKAPKSIALDLDMSFGDFFADVIEGKCDIEISFGSLKVNKMTNKQNEIFVEFGDAVIDDFAANDIEISFGSLQVERFSSNSEINSSYGEVRIYKVDSSVDDLELNCSFGSIRLTLDSSASFTIKASSSFGNVSMDKKISITKSEEGMFSEEKSGTLGSGSGRIDIENSYGDVNIDVE